MQEDIKFSAFSSERLYLLLDNLLDAYEAQGINLESSFLPPIEEEEIKDLCTWFPTDLPKEIIALYGWRGGQKDDASSPFWFRDNIFHTLNIAKLEYESMMETYGSNPEDHELLKYSFPFASFDGSFYVLPSKGHLFNPNLDKPVICVFQGIDVFFYSIETMISTCIDWVNNRKYENDGSLPEKIEMDIWKKNNPGIFEV